MAQSTRNPDHVWLVMIKAMQAISRYALADLEKSGLGDSDFRVLEAHQHLSLGDDALDRLGRQVFERRDLGKRQADSAQRVVTNLSNQSSSTSVFMPTTLSTTSTSTTTTPTGSA